MSIAELHENECDFKTICHTFRSVTVALCYFSWILSRAASRFNVIFFFFVHRKFRSNEFSDPGWPRCSTEWTAHQTHQVKPKFRCSFFTFFSFLGSVFLTKFFSSCSLRFSSLCFASITACGCCCRVCVKQLRKLFFSSFFSFFSFCFGCFCFLSTSSLADFWLEQNFSCVIFMI